MSKFKVGDMCEILPFFGPEDQVKYIGMECTITKILENDISGQVYEIQFKTNELKEALEFILKKIEPERGDMDTIVSWEDMPWKPIKEIMEN